MAHAITVIVEDGTGLSNANSYLSETDADEYFVDFTNTAWIGSADAMKAALIKATQFIDALFNGRWRGTRTNRTQALAWPRSSMVDQDGFVEDTNVIPTKLEHATAELAVMALTETLMPNQSNPGTIKMERDKVGPIETEVEYNSKSQQKYYSLALKLLGQYVHSGGFVERG